jgi:hypothetical protein
MPSVICWPSIRRAVARALLPLVVLGVTAGAQRTDSARVAAQPLKVDTVVRNELRPPLTPRRAFVYSFLAPGLGQSRLGRPVAGAIFVFTESIAIAMLRESAADLRQAKRFRSDSLMVIGTDPLTGSTVTLETSFNDELIRIRKSHVEDWIAFLIANHLFAGADAYVAAHLWDLPAQMQVSQTPHGTVIAARLRW